MPRYKLSGVDKCFFHIEDSNHLMTVASCSIFYDNLSVNDLKDTLTLMINQYPRFKQRVTEPLYITKARYWEDYNFNLDDHINEIILPCFSDNNCSDDYSSNIELQNTLSELYTTPFDHKKALWAVELIHYHPKRSALFFRVHHSVTDGQGAIRCLLSITKQTHDNNLQYGKHNTQKQQESSSYSLSSCCGYSFKLLFYMLYFIYTILWGFILCFWHFISIFFFFKRNHFNGSLTTEKSVSFDGNVSLDKIKEIKNYFNVSVNDVLISALAGSFQEYILNTEQSIKDKDLLTYIPFSMRKPDDWELGNKVSLLYAYLPLKINDPLERLQIVHKRMDKIKYSKEPLATYFFTSTIGNSPLSDTSISKWILRKSISKPHAIFTNVPGPRTHLTYAGKRIEVMFPFIPHPCGGGFGVALLSYVDKIVCTLVADKTLLPEGGGKKITSGLEKHVNKLYDLIPKNLNKKQT